MDIGRMRHKIEFEERTASKDASGAPLDIWATHTTCWASVEPLRGSEAEISSRIDSSLTHKVTCRSQDVSTVNPSMRIRMTNEGDRVLDIESKRRVMERDVMVEFMCREKVEVGA